MAINLSQQLHDALVHYAETEAAVVSAGRRSDADRKLDLVRARRKFAEQLGLLGLLIVQDRVLAETPDIQQDMNRLFTAFRFALGQHQANWPAVRIDEDPQGYAQSAWEAYSKSDQFWAWCLTNLNFRREASSRPDRLVSPAGPRGS
ncbi:MAG TPA: hypothetical protein VGE65_03260 [Sphingobium sp.]